MPENNQKRNLSTATRSQSFLDSESDEMDKAAEEIDAQRRQELLEQTRVNQAAGALVQLSNDSWNVEQGNAKKEDYDHAEQENDSEVGEEVEEDGHEDEDDVETEEEKDSVSEGDSDSGKRKGSKK